MPPRPAQRTGGHGCGGAAAAGYGLEPTEIALAVEWLRLNPPKEPLPLDTAIKLGKQGRPKKGEEKGADGTLKRGSTV
jgi:hypothetical protein